MKLFLKAGVMAALMGFAATSCDSYKDNETPDKFVEADKDLSGVWSLTKVMRNNVDITSTMDFSKFRLRLNPDGSYSLENRLPFPVRHSGLWSVDDPAHPFMLSFTEDGAIGAMEVGIQYPIVNGMRQLSITHSPGCGSNKYEYLFVKANN
ncbi:MAG: DUF5004 domain-containing protein [Muribaculaceae bacterium]|jgi:hypothetical protein|nr:DUF5004 domain-containing protein [Muribaculaceae bacterium]